MPAVCESVQGNELGFKKLKLMVVLADCEPAVAVTVTVKALCATAEFTLATLPFFVIVTPERVVVKL